MYTSLKETINSISPISDKDWEMMEPYLTMKKYKRGDYYFNSGNIEKKIGFIHKGNFKWYYINDKGEEINFHFFFQNEFVVEYYSFLSQNSSPMFIKALEDSDVILLPDRKKILGLYSNSHNWERFGRIISERVYAKTALRVHDFLFKTAEERYSSLLEKHPDIFQKVSLANIASFLGIQPPSLSRIRKRLSEQ